MSQCVPSWDLDENLAARISLSSRPDASNPNVPIRLNFGEIAELTWKNGQLNMHGHGFGTQPRVETKPETSTNWDKPRAGGTLESIVNQATTQTDSNNQLTWFNNQQPTGTDSAATAATVTMDALVPARINSSSACGVHGSTRIESCPAPIDDNNVNINDLVVAPRENIARIPTSLDWGGRDQSVSITATFGLDSQILSAHDTFDIEVGSIGSPMNTISDMPLTGATGVIVCEENDPGGHGKRQREADDDGDQKKPNGKSSLSTKRSRAAAIHNQSERKRRDKINQKMKTLQKLVPNSSKTDKASMLDEVIEYLKQLQAQVVMMSRVNIPPMMLPLTMQQQLQMSLMSSMGIMGMGMMDMNPMGRANMPPLPSVIPSPFMPITWDNTSSNDRLQASTSNTAIMDPMSFFTCQSQPMNMETYARMAAVYQQLQQQQTQASTSKT